LPFFLQHCSHHFLIYYHFGLLLCNQFLSSVTVDRISIETRDVLVVMIFYQSNESGATTSYLTRTEHCSFFIRKPADVIPKLFITFFFCMCLKNSVFFSDYLKKMFFLGHPLHYCLPNYPVVPDK
jgi:hypothetical protein